MQKPLHDKIMETFYRKPLEVFQLKGGHDWIGSQAYLGRQPVPNFQEPDLEAKITQHSNAAQVYDSRAEHQIQYQ